MYFKLSESSYEMGDNQPASRDFNNPKIESLHVNLVISIMQKMIMPLK
ncbi:MAG: hypothetical protein ACI8XG_001354 [Congregibacter sp.]|jgi:hypothetical protein